MVDIYMYRKRYKFTIYHVYIYSIYIYNIYIYTVYIYIYNIYIQYIYIQYIYIYIYSIYIYVCIYIYPYIYVYIYPILSQHSFIFWWIDRVISMYIRCTSPMKSPIFLWQRSLWNRQRVDVPFDQSESQLRGHLRNVHLLLLVYRKNPHENHRKTIGKWWFNGI